jgi:Spy/CpxP family protein refolding chaperone
MKQILSKWLLGFTLIFIPTIAMGQLADAGHNMDGMIGGEEGGMNGFKGRHCAGKEHHKMGVIAHLGLSPDQLKKFQHLKLQHQKEAIPLFGRIRLASIEIQELRLGEPVEMEKIKSKVKEKYNAMAELEIIHQAFHQQVKALLTPEQRQKMELLMMKQHHLMEMREGFPGKLKKEHSHKELKGSGELEQEESHAED